MDRSRFDLTRRQTLLLGGSAAAAFSMGWPGSMAFAQSSMLRAGITGYNVINTLDPGKATLIPEFYVIWGLYNALMKFDAKMNAVPDLAESVKVSEDGALEFKLRQGVKFHDGSDLTADDVKFTIERLLDDKFASPNKSKVSAVDRVEVPDALTVRFITKEPFAPLLTFLSNARTGTQILSRKAVSAAGEDFGRKPVGTGAYMLKDWRPGERVTVTAFDNYFGGKPKIATIDMPLIAEESSGVTALLGGQIELTSTAPFADIPTLQQNPSITVLKQPGMNCRYIALNHRRPPFDDPAFRRACSLAFDRNAMVRAILFGEGVASAGLIPPSLDYAYRGPTHPLTTHNAERAKAELAKSKYKAGQDGIVLTWGQTWWKRIAEVFTAQVNQTLGTKLTVEVTEANTVFQRLRAGDYQASAWGWLGFIDPDEYTYDILHTKGWRNFHGYSNPKLDAMFEQARRELDRSKRGAIYKEAETTMLEDMPILPCFCSNIHNLMTKKVHGFQQLPFSNFGDQFANLAIS
ncbi:MAG TPA: ABC transporter substrate-binding protein [Microvirga sp.]|nr:ABC transporter substrate-binding protein [Microvirga sp.]